MRKKILYVLDHIVLDLSEPNLGHPNGLDILQRHYRQSERPSMGFNHGNPAFICITHEGGTNPGLFAQKRNGEWWAIHYEPGDCRSHRLPAPMSDEHKRQTEYWARAAQDAGWNVDLEHALHTGTRPDALIYGPVKTGVEVQRSAMTPGRAVVRTGKATSAGVTDVWYSDWTTPPRWAWRVPTVLPVSSALTRAWTISRRGGRRCPRGARSQPQGSGGSSRLNARWSTSSAARTAGTGAASGIRSQ